MWCNFSPRLESNVSNTAGRTLLSVDGKVPSRLANPRGEENKAQHHINGALLESGFTEQLGWQFDSFKLLGRVKACVASLLAKNFHGGSLPQSEAARAAGAGIPLLVEFSKLNKRKHLQRC